MIRMVGASLFFFFLVYFRKRLIYLNFSKFSYVSYLFIHLLVIEALEPIKFKDSGYPIVNYDTMQTTDPDIFCGGDFAGIAETTVESVNDGKTAAWFMHQRIQVSKKY